MTEHEEDDSGLPNEHARRLGCARGVRDGGAVIPEVGGQRELRVGQGDVPGDGREVALAIPAQRLVVGEVVEVARLVVPSIAPDDAPASVGVGEMRIERDGVLVGAHGAGPVGRFVARSQEIVGQLDVSPQPVDPRAVAYERAHERGRAAERGGIALLGQVDGVAVGLGLAIDVLRRRLDQGRQVRLGPGVLLGRRGPRAGGQRHARGRAVDFAGDRGLVAEPADQQALQLPDRDARLGNLDLDLVVPVVGVGGGRAHRGGGALHPAEVVQQHRGDDLTGQTAGGHVGRDGERLDHQPLLLGRRPGHPADGDGDT